MLPRLLLIAPHCDSTDVGEAWSTFQWVSRLARRYQVTVLNYNKRDRPSASSQLGGVEVIEWRDYPLVGRFERLNSGVAPGYLAFYFHARKWLERNLKRRTFEIVHQLSPLALRYPCPAAGICTPLVIGPLGGSLPTPDGFRSEVRGGAWYTRLRALDGWRLRHDPSLRRSYASADLIIGVAPYVRRLLSGIPIHRFEVMSETGVVSLPTPGDVKDESRPGIRLLFVGRVVRTKGVRDAIRAMEHLRDRPSITLDVIGSGDDLANCWQEAEKLGMGDRVVFHGALPRARIDWFYRRADILLFPSLREPSGNVVLEAMAHGLALIVADNGGPAAAVDEACGIRIAPTTPRQYPLDLAIAVRRLADNPDLLDAMKLGARRRAEGLFLWDRKVEWMCQQYEQVLFDRTVSRVKRGAPTTILEPSCC